MTAFNLSLKNTTCFLPTPLNHLPSIQSKPDKSVASKKLYENLKLTYASVLNTDHLMGDLCAVSMAPLCLGRRQRSYTNEGEQIEF